SRVSIRAALVEVTAIDDAARDREAPALRLDGEFLRREYVPHDERTLEVGVAAIAAVVRQPQLARGELACRRDVFQSRAQLGRRARLGDDARDVLPLRDDLHLPGEGLQVIAAGQEGDGEGEQEKS